MFKIRYMFEFDQIDILVARFMNHSFSLQTFEKRGNYCELAELVDKNLSEDDDVRYPFHKQGSISHARFVGKSLYYLKLALLLRAAGILKFSKKLSRRKKTWQSLMPSLMLPDS